MTFIFHMYVCMYVCMCCFSQCPTYPTVNKRWTCNCSYQSDLRFNYGLIRLSPRSLAGWGSHHFINHLVALNIFVIPLLFHSEVSSLCVCMAIASLDVILLTHPFLALAVFIPFSTIRHVPDIIHVNGCSTQDDGLLSIISSLFADFYIHAIFELIN